MQLEVGSIVEGKVKGITKFGAFVELSDGKVGLVHISEVASTFVKEVKDHLTEGQAVKVKILNISDDGKIGLSIKQAMCDADSGKVPFSKNSGMKNVSGGVSILRDKAKTAPSFEEMMAKFKKASDEKMSDLKRANEIRHGGSSRRGGQQR